MKTTEENVTEAESPVIEPDLERCQVHPEEAVTARCLRFNRRYCERDFESGNPPECLSAGTYCQYRQQCLIWEKLRGLRRQRKQDNQ